MAWSQRGRGVAVRAGGRRLAVAYEVTLAAEKTRHLLLRWRLTNPADEPMPAGIGFHPWWRRPVRTRGRHGLCLETVAPTPEPRATASTCARWRFADGLDGTWTVRTASRSSWPGRSSACGPPSQLAGSLRGGGDPGRPGRDRRRAADPCSRWAKAPAGWPARRPGVPPLERRWRSTSRSASVVVDLPVLRTAGRLELWHGTRAVPVVRDLGASFAVRLGAGAVRAGSHPPAGCTSRRPRRSGTASWTSPSRRAASWAAATSALVSCRGARCTVRAMCSSAAIFSLTPSDEPVLITSSTGSRSVRPRVPAGRRRGPRASPCKEAVIGGGRPWPASRARGA